LAAQDINPDRKTNVKHNIIDGCNKICTLLTDKVAVHWIQTRFRNSPLHRYDVGDARSERGRSNVMT